MTNSLMELSETTLVTADGVEWPDELGPQPVWESLSRFDTPNRRARIPMYSLALQHRDLAET